jgi:hypothetical protein
MADDKSFNLPALPDQVSSAIEALTTQLNVPRDVLASDEDIFHAWNSLPREIKEIPEELRGELVARMCVAVSTGLFDSALNYIWNAAILHLRDKVRNFGLPVVAQILQKDFEEHHLSELQDSRLIELCLKLNIIDEDGFFFLDQCRETRNNFSAAHPVMGQINDREFIAFVNRCVKYALSNAASPQGVDLSSFMRAVKSAKFNDDQLKVWVDRLNRTHNAQRTLLIGTLHGIYCDPSSGEETRVNALNICKEVQSEFNQSIRSELMTRHADYLAHGEEKRHEASRKFFENLGLLALLHESEQHRIFEKAVERLVDAHKGMNNFYNEPPFAERLAELSEQSEVPETVQAEYVNAVVGCFMGNGYGVSWSANPHYEKMIRGFSPREIKEMVRAPYDDRIIGQKIKNHTCRQRFSEALKLIEPASVPSSAQANFEHFLKGGTLN